MTISLDTVKKYAPTVYFHENERYFPCSIEFLLKDGTLKDRNNPDWFIQNPGQAHLREYAASNYYVVINPTQYRGMGVTAPMYYAVQEYEDAVQISYLMLYAYQGGQTCRALRAGTEFNSIISTLGIHQGDLERIVVTLIPRGEGQYQVLSVGYEAHGDVHYLPPQRIAWDDGHPVVNVALNGHSCHSLFHEGDRVTEFEQPGAVAVISALGQNGLVWRPAIQSEFKLLGLDGHGGTTSGEVWAVFQGRLGDSQLNGFTSATYFDGSNLNAADWAFAKLTDWAATMFDVTPRDIKHGDGPSGPGGREWCSPAKGKILGDGLMRLQAIDDVGEGPRAVAWLTGNVDSLARPQIVQCWGNGSSLGMIMYGSDGAGGLQRLWHSDDMGEGPGAVAWLQGNFFGDELKEIVQCWSNGSRLGMSMYGNDGAGGIRRLWRSDDMGEGPGAVSWQVGDFNGDGKAEILQCWGNGSSLGMIMYGSNGAGGLQRLWSSDDMGEGPGAVSWQVGDFNGDGKAEVLQCWGNGSRLGMAMYGSNGAGGLQRLWRSDDMGEGPGAVSWQVGDFNGDGKAELVQCWGNGSSLGMIMYGSNGAGGLQRLWSSGDMGEGPGAVSWQVGDFNSDGKAELVQCWGNGSSLGMVMYGSNGAGGLQRLWRCDDMDEGPGAVTWQIGDFNGDGKVELIQCWGNGSSLGMIMYGTA